MNSPAEAISYVSARRSANISYNRNPLNSPLIPLLHTFRCILKGDSCNTDMFQINLEYRRKRKIPVRRRYNNFVCSRKLPGVSEIWIVKLSGSNEANVFSSVFHSFLFGVLQNSSASHFAFCQLQYLSATYFFCPSEISRSHPLTSPLPPVLNTVSRLPDRFLLIRLL